MRWLPPEEFNSNTILYEIHWQTENSINKVKNKQQKTLKGHELATGPRNLMRNFTLEKLQPNHTYLVWLRAYSTNSTFSESQIANIETFPEPENIQLISETPYNLEISWHAPLFVKRYLIKYKSSSSNNNITWVEVFDSALQSGPKDNTSLEHLLISNLTPKTQYNFVMFLHYKNRLEPYIWPIDSMRFIYETLGDKPSTPGKPHVQYVSGEAYQVIWATSRENGASIEEYVLEGIQRRKEVVIADGAGEEKKVEKIVEQDSDEQEWQVYYNGTNNYWITSSLKNIHLYGFRVRTRNSYGWSNYSTESEPVIDHMDHSSSEALRITQILVPIFVILIIMICLSVAILCGK